MSADIESLRLRAEQAVRAEDDDELLALVAALREDGEWWPHLWAPAAAISASRAGIGDPLSFLREAVEGGFAQPEMFEGQLEAAFGQAPEWPGFVEAMRANVPVPEIELTRWPTPAPSGPLVLYDLPAHRAEALRGRVPEPVASAWLTSLGLLQWTHAAWAHANAHVETPDAVQILDRVAEGARFACVEYAIVLAQSLNAVGVPARRVDLRQAHHHAGVGRGHVVTEAWIDNLDKWVLLDPQNGAYWAAPEGPPLGLLDLEQIYADGSSPPGFVEATGEVIDRGPWFSYFASASTTGYTWSARPFAPIFQGTRLIETPRLLTDPASAYPCLPGDSCQDARVARVVDSSVGARDATA